MFSFKSVEFPAVTLPPSEKYDVLYTYDEALGGWSYEAWEGSKILARSKRMGLSLAGARWFAKIWLERQLAWDEAQRPIIHPSPSSYLLMKLYSYS